MNKNVENDKTIWCVCDGQDEKKIVLLSAHQKYGKIVNTIVTINEQEPLSNYSQKLKETIRNHMEITPSNSVRKVTCQ